MIINSLYNMVENVNNVRITRANIKVEMARLCYSRDFWKLGDDEKRNYIVLRGDDEIVLAAEDVMRIYYKKHFDFQYWYKKLLILLGINISYKEVAKQEQNKDETVREYILRVQKSGNDCGMPNRKIAETIINGVDKRYNLVRRFLLKNINSFNLEMLEEVALLEREDINTSLGYATATKDNLYMNNSISSSIGHVDNKNVTKVYINRKICEAILDTGSFSNFLTLADVNYLGLKVKRCNEEKKFYTCLDQEFLVKYFVETAVEFKGRKHTLKFYVFPDIVKKSKIIIGSISMEEIFKFCPKVDIRYECEINTPLNKRVVEPVYQIPKKIRG